MKSGNLNFLEPSGPLQACNGTALPIPIYIARKQNNFEITSSHSKEWYLWREFSFSKYSPHFMELG
jgi:hypothetical protein